jgi:hypothetical protein
MNQTAIIKNGIGSHQSASMMNDEWLTPPQITKALGPFDLDPCSPVKRPWDTARIQHYTINDNGLLMPWFGFVWCNPPYGKQAARWLELMTIHNNGIALIFARTETDMFQKFVWPHASSILFIYGRLYFHNVDGSRAKSNAGAPSLLVGYGDEANRRLMNCGIDGQYIKLK